MKKLSIIAVVLIGLVFAVSASAGLADKLGKIAEISGTRIGCATPELMKRMQSIAATGDEVAYKKAILRGVIAENIAIFDEGEKVYVIEVAVWSSLVKVRPVGEDLEWWLSESSIR